MVIKKLFVLLCIGSCLLAVQACSKKQPAETTQAVEEPEAEVEAQPNPEPQAEEVVETVEETEPEAEAETALTAEISTAEEAEPEDEEPHLYDRAQVRDVLNGIRTEKLGEYSVILADSSECTDEALVDWYLNYILKNDFNYNFIVFTDKEGLCIFEAGGIIEIGDEVSRDEYGDYNHGNNSNARIIAIYEDGSIQEFSDD